MTRNSIPTVQQHKPEFIAIINTVQSVHFTIIKITSVSFALPTFEKGCMEIWQLKSDDNINIVPYIRQKSHYKCRICSRNRLDFFVISWHRTGDWCGIKPVHDENMRAYCSNFDSGCQILNSAVFSTASITKLRPGS